MTPNTGILCIGMAFLFFGTFDVLGEFYSEKEFCSDQDDCTDGSFTLKKMEAPGVSAKLLFVQLIFRHGDRTPAIIYKNDPNPLSSWEEGLGMLTKLGRKQHYRLGRYLRKRYKDFATFSPTQVKVTSTGYDRALRSAESHLAGLFAPPKEWQLEEGLNWQPIPIEYLPKKEDRYLLPIVPCVRADQEAARALHSEEGQKFLSEHKETFKQLTIHSGEKDLDFNMASAVFDTIKVEKKYNLKVPAWIEPYWDEMNNVTDLLYGWWFKTPMLKRLRTGPLIERLIGNMKKKMSGELPQQKFHVFSAHDQTVAMAMTGLQVHNEKQPPYCATLALELHEMTDGSNALRLLYFNSTEPETKIDEPHVLTIPGCSEFCPLDYVIKFVHHIIPTDWEEECQREAFIK